jgi:hypothetical protein
VNLRSQSVREEVGKVKDGGVRELFEKFAGDYN